MICETWAGDFILLHNFREWHGCLNLGKLSELWCEGPLKPSFPSRPSIPVFTPGHLAADYDLEGNQEKWLLKAHGFTRRRKMTFAKSKISKSPEAISPLTHMYGPYIFTLFPWFFFFGNNLYTHLNLTLDEHLNGWVKQEVTWAILAPCHSLEFHQWQNNLQDKSQPLIVLFN